MLINYLKIAWRNAIRNKLYTSLHIVGLGLGIVCCVFIYLYVDFHLSFDRYHQQAGRTFRLVNELHLETTEYEKGASYAMYETLRSNVPGVDQAAFLISDQEFTIRIEEKVYKTSQRAAITSSAWFDLFDYRWLRGDPKQLDEPNTVALTAKVAKKYFGANEPLGKTILIKGKHPFKVVGIIDDSRKNTSLKWDMYLSLASLRTLQPDIWDNFFTDWGYINSSNNLFVSLQSASQQSSLERMLKQLTEKRMGSETAKYFSFKLLPLRDSHFDTRYGGTVQMKLLVILAIIGGCIMAVAGINYINMSIAQQTRRSMEIGARRIFGGSRSQLFFQLMIESTMIILMALGCALLLASLLLPVANRQLFGSEPVEIVSWTRLWGFSIVLWILVSLGTGIYPAILLSKLNVSDALKKKLPLRSRFGRESLVVVQNLVAQVMIIAAIVIALQVHFLQNTDVGFDRTSVVTLPLPEHAAARRNVIDQYLLGDSRVAAHTFCYRPPASDQRKGGTVLFDDRTEWETWPARSVFGDTSYLQTFDVQLTAGRNIRERANTPEYLINEKMVSMLGFDRVDQVLGKTLLAGGMNDEEKGIIVGVVNDFNTRSLLEPIEPTVVGIHPEFSRTLAFKVSDNNARALLEDLQQQWTKLFPNEVFDYHFLDEQIDKLYERQILQQKLIWIAAAIAVLISSLGLLGMISMMTLLRTKEIGIRKTLGASVANILILLTRHFVRLVFIAVLLAVPLAWYVTSSWLNNFAYRIELEWWVFALAGLLAVVIALLTVSLQSIKAALMNPVESLRSE